MNKDINCFPFTNLESAEHAFFRVTMNMHDEPSIYISSKTVKYRYEWRLEIFVRGNWVGKLYRYSLSL